MKCQTKLDEILTLYFLNMHAKSNQNASNIKYIQVIHG